MNNRKFVGLTSIAVIAVLMIKSAILLIKLKDQPNNEKNLIPFLEESKRIHVEDFKSLVYPKCVKFGYVSFIIFAISEVIFPLTHKWWPLYLLNHFEIFGLSAFGIGLILTFIYLGLELRNAFSSVKHR